MLRSAVGRLAKIDVLRAVFPSWRVSCVIPTRFKHGEPPESAEQFDARFINFFNRPDIDGFMVRHAMTELIGDDLIPEPDVIKAALIACRRVNDYALAVRFLEAIKNCCGGQVGVIYPYILQEIKPLLNDLGIDTPEELGYDKPELALESVFEM